MDAFFAAVVMRDRPELRNVPMAVGGSSNRGVLSTSNYEARKFGVRSAMPTKMALKLCPHLVVAKASMSKIKEASRQVFEIFHEYTDLVEGMSLDEAYLDVTDCQLFHNSATLIAQDIRRRIFEKTQLTASAGIANNKLIAKMASDFRKPNGQFTVAPPSVDEFIKTIPIEKLWGIGKVTAAHLHGMGIKTCLDMQGYSRNELIYHFGKFGNNMYDYCRGVDERQIDMNSERKSYGSEETFNQDISNYEEMRAHIVRMSEELKNDLAKYDDRIVKNLHVKIKYHDFKQTTIERKLPVTTENFLELLEERWSQDPRPVRLLGVGVKFEETKSTPSSKHQLSLLESA
jgi:DNA polymerase-4